MSNVLLDVLTLKRIEREIGRVLTEEEIEGVRYQGYLIARKPNGELVGFKVLRYRLPSDLMFDGFDQNQIQTEEDFFESVGKLSESVDNFFDDEE